MKLLKELFSAVIKKFTGETSSTIASGYDAKKQAHESRIKNSRFLNAIKNCSESIALEILEGGGVFLEEKDIFGEATLLLVAIRKHKFILAKRLVEMGANIHAHTTNYENALTLSIKAENEDLAMYLLEKGLPIRTEFLPDSGTPLQSAANLGLARVVAELIRRGADVNDTRGRGFDTISCATGPQGSVEVIELLLANGADVNSRDNGCGHTPLMRAASHGRLDMVEFLLANGADPEFQENDLEHDEYGINALMFAAKIGNIDIIKRILDTGVSLEIATGTINEKSRFVGRPVMMNSIRDEMSPEVASIDARLVSAYFGKTALWFAVENNRIEAARYLIQCGADTQIRDQTGDTLLAPAVKKKWLEMVKLLVPLCPSFHAQNNYGYSIYDYAEKNCPEIYKYFQSLED